MKTTFVSEYLKKVNTMMRMKMMMMMMMMVTGHSQDEVVSWRTRAFLLILFNLGAKVVSI